MRSLALIACGLLCACTSWNRSPGAAGYTTPFPFTKPAPPHPLANLDPDHPAFPLTSPESGPSPPPSAPAPVAPDADQQPRRPTTLLRTTAKGISLTLLAFDDRHLSLHVADKAAGPDTQWQSAQEAAKSHQAIAAINASFFTPEGEPLGLVIENGTRFGSWNRASSLTSGVLAIRNGLPQLSRREQWAASAPADYLLQAGPLLLEHGTRVSGLSSSPARSRSFMAWDGRHHWMIGAATSATLADLAAALATQPVSDSRFSIALNLDGGRSCDLWISPSIAGGPVSTRRFWNNPVRNYIVLKEHP